MSIIFRLSYRATDSVLVISYRYPVLVSNSVSMIESTCTLRSCSLLSSIIAWVVFREIDRVDLSQCLISHIGFLIQSQGLTLETEVSTLSHAMKLSPELSLFKLL